MKISAVLVVCGLGLLFVFTFLFSTCSSKLRITQKNTKFGQKSVWVSSLMEKLCHGLLCVSGDEGNCKQVVVLVKNEEMLPLVADKLTRVNNFAEFREVAKSPELTTLGYFSPQGKKVKVKIRNKYWVRIKEERYICKMVPEKRGGIVSLPENILT